MKQKLPLYLILAAAAFLGAALPKAEASEEILKRETPYSELAIEAEPEVVDAFAGNYVTYDASTREMRGAWIATVKNTNMAPGMNADAFTAWANETCELLSSSGFNTVIFQVRPTADALYKSEIAPWASYITDRPQGTDPGYDPLAIMLSAAHSRGMELHAWVNPYRVTMPSDTLEGLAENNIGKQHPEWLVKYGSQYYLNPGIPEVVTHLTGVIMEIVRNYDIDAIHIDDYFYPYAVSGQIYNDSEAFAAYGADFTDIGDWRRDNVTKLINSLYTSIKAEKHWVQLGISPFGVWRNISSDPTGSNTRAGHECYDTLYADTRTWISQGIIDYITPQIYWSTQFDVANYTVLSAWWAKEIETYATVKPVNLYVGMADYKVGDNADAQWNNPGEIAGQITLNRENSTISGQVHYSINAIKANKLNYLDNVRNTLYSSKALNPAVPAADYQIPDGPASLDFVKEATGISLQISASDANIRKYAIYRFDSYSPGTFTDSNLIAVVYKGNNETTTYLDSTAETGKAYTYAVKAISSAGTLSEAYQHITLQ